jgi:holin-like protein
LRPAGGGGHLDRMIEAILLILLCQLSGEAAARLLALPVPGPVIGMALLFIGLQFRRVARPEAPPAQASPVGAASGFLLAHLSLLFVPAGVGIVAHLPTLARHGPGLVAALVVSTLLSLAVTALVFAALSRRAGDGP